GPSKALGRDTTMLREILDQTAERIGKELTNQPEVEIDLREILAKTYEELGLYSEMMQMSRQELRLARSYFGEGSEPVGMALGTLAIAEFHLGDYDEAERSARACLEITQKLRKTESVQIATVMDILGVILQSRSKLEEAETMQRDALAMRQKLLGH